MQCEICATINSLDVTNYVTVLSVNHCYWLLYYTKVDVLKLEISAPQKRGKWGTIPYTDNSPGTELGLFLQKFHLRGSCHIPLNL
jgi:hypothetical protein